MPEFRPIDFRNRLTVSVVDDAPFDQQWVELPRIVNVIRVKGENFPCLGLPSLQVA